MLEEIKKAILDTLYPISCVFCQADDFWICEKCLANLKLLENQVCPYCEEILEPSGRFCQKCYLSFLKKNTEPPLDHLISAGAYKEEIAKLVHLFKYNFIEDLGEPLGKFLTTAFLFQKSAVPDILIPVPLHPRRLRWRGFNQSEILANYLAENLTPGFPLEIDSQVLFRKKYTEPQMKLKNYAERQKNLENAFVIKLKNQKNNIRGKHILIIDDICTTGATLFECARLLKSAGAKKVSALVLARQEME